MSCPCCGAPCEWGCDDKPPTAAEIERRAKDRKAAALWNERKNAESRRRMESNDDAIVLRVALRSGMLDA